MKKTLIVSACFFVLANNIWAQIAPGPTVVPGDCIQGSNLTPSWFSGNYKLTSSCTDVNVGIGTNYPVCPLHVVGKAQIDWIVTQQIGIGTSNLGSASFKIQCNGPSNFAMTHLKQTGLSPYKKMIFMEVEDPSVEIIKVMNTTQGEMPFLLTADGRMVIKNGTQTILQLENYGLLRARRIKIDTDVWPDYVFNRDYNLLSLKDLEFFILNEKHLPNIPSQQDVLNNGLDLGEMNVLLLEKIEELTLYIIQQQKEIESIKKIITN